MGTDSRPPSRVPVHVNLGLGVVLAATLYGLVLAGQARAVDSTVAGQEPPAPVALHEGSLAVGNRPPLDLYVLETSSVSMVSADDTVWATIGFTLVAGMKPDYGCVATMRRVYEGKGPLSDPLSLEMLLVDSSDELEGGDCSDVSVPVVGSQPLNGTFSADGTFTGTMRNAWLVTAVRTGGVVEIDGAVHLISPPGGVLQLTRADLPEWARGAVAVVGDVYVRVGPPGTLAGGDPGVLLDGLPVVRVGDQTESGGVITDGTALIFVNGAPVAVVGDQVVDPMLIGGGFTAIPMVGGPILGRPDSLRGGFYPHHHTFLAEAAKRGATRIRVTDDGSLKVGDMVMIGGKDDHTLEVTRVAGKGSLLLDRPLQYEHPAGEWVVQMPAEYADRLEPAPAAVTSETSPRPASTTPSPTPTAPAEGATTTSIGPALLVIASAWAALVAVVVVVLFILLLRRERKGPHAPGDRS